MPAAFLLALVTASITAVFWHPAGWILAGLLSSYFLVLTVAGLIEAFRSELKLWPAIVVALAALHLGYGWGSLMGCLRMVAGPLPTDRIFEKVTR